jgi:hypothetical protein
MSRYGVTRKGNVYMALERLLTCVGLLASCFAEFFNFWNTYTLPIEFSTQFKI